MKSSTKELLKSLNKEEVIEYLKTHTKSETIKHFNITKRVITLFLQDTGLEDAFSYNHSMNTRANRKFVDSVNAINAYDLIAYYNSHSRNSTLDKFNITNKILNYILETNGVEKHARLENTKLTCMERYGVDNPSKDTKVIDKIANVKLERYGNSTYVNPDKIKKTCLDRYGVTCSAQSDIVKAKIENVMLQKYGAKTYFGSEIGIAKSHANRQDNYWDSVSYSDEYKSIRLDKEKSLEFVKNNYMSREELAERFNCPVASVSTWIRTFCLYEYIKANPTGGTSDFEDSVIKYIESIYSGTIIKHDRKALDNKEIDIYVPEKHIGIECNGDYWHSDLQKPKNYHVNKSLEAESKGIRLIHIYQSEWDNMQDKIKSMLKIAFGCTDSRVYARQCEVKLISNKEAKPFNDSNHMQSHRNASVTYGLFYNNELVQLMSFSKHPKYEWEIIRGCPASNNIVVGGVSKLFKTFIKDYNPKSIFSYCDFNKFDGHGYESLGMRFIGYTGPDKKYLMPDGTVINRNPHRHKELTESARAIIWGSGSKKYLWENKAIG